MSSYAVNLGRPLRGGEPRRRRLPNRCIVTAVEMPCLRAGEGRGGQGREGEGGIPQDAPCPAQAYTVPGSPVPGPINHALPRIQWNAPRDNKKQHQTRPLHGSRPSPSSASPLYAPPRGTGPANAGGAKGHQPHSSPAEASPPMPDALSAEKAHHNRATIRPRCRGNPNRPLPRTVAFATSR